MTDMSAYHAPRRRTRRAVAIAAIALSAWALAGCSSSDSEADAMTVAEFDGGAPETVAGADASTAYDGERAGADGDEERTGEDRSVIVTGDMYMTVDDPIAAAEQAASIVEGAGGRVDSRSETAPGEGYGGSAWLTLRIPADDLDAVVQELRVLGTVDEYSTSSYDVTIEVTDLEAQISTLRASTERIEGLLLEAVDIEDIITLEDELDSRRSELESLEAQQRGLDDQVSMSTIGLSLTTEPVVINDDDPDSFWSGLVTGWNGLVGFLSGALVVLGVLLPWLALAALVTLVVIVLVRRRRRRREARKRTAAHDAHSAPSATSAQTPSEAPTPPHGRTPAGPAGPAGSQR